MAYSPSASNLTQPVAASHLSDHSHLETVGSNVVPGNVRLSLSRSNLEPREKSWEWAASPFGSAGLSGWALWGPGTCLLSPTTRPLEEQGSTWEPLWHFQRDGRALMAQARGSPVERLLSAPGLLENNGISARHWRERGQGTKGKKEGAVGYCKGRASLWS